MAEIQFQYAWGTTTTFGSFTNLHSLADGNIWRSGSVTDTSPTTGILQISYNIVFNATPIAGDYLGFWVVGDDGDGTTPYWPGSIAATQGAITTAATISEFLQAAGQPNQLHFWATSHGTTFRGHFLAWNYRPVWQVCVRTFGEALASSGNVVRYRYITGETVGA